MLRFPDTSFWATLGTLLVAGLIVLNLVIRRSYWLTVYGDCCQAVMLVIATVLIARNLKVTTGRQRVFWALMTASSAMWTLTQFLWAYWELGLRNEVPNPWSGDVVLFLHVVPMMAALALKPHITGEGRTRGLGAMDLVLLLLWWVYLYLYIVTPWQYVSLNEALYGTNFNLLYLLENGLVLCGVGALCFFSRGVWRTIYAHLFGAAVLYNLASHFASVAIDEHKYYTGSSYDIPLLMSFAWFMVMGSAARKLLAHAQPETAVTQESNAAWPARLGMAAILSIPLFAGWAAFFSDSPREVVHFRLYCSLAAMVLLTFLLLMKQQLMNRHLTELLREAKHAEELQSALYSIAEASSSADDLPQFFAVIHRIIGKLMYARNCFIALLDPATQTVNFPYWVDEKDPHPGPQKMGKTLTDYILRTGQPLLALPHKLRELELDGEIERAGAPSLDWMGVPLKKGEVTFGVLVVQSYEKDIRFGEKEKELLTFVSRHVASAVDHKFNQEALRRSEARYRSLVESAVYGIYVSDTKENLVSVNPALVTMLGYQSAEELVGRNLARDICADSAEHSRLVQGLRATGRLQGHEAIWKRAEGGAIRVRLSGRLFTDEQTGAEQVEMIVEDITERRALEEQFRQAQKMEAVGQLAGGVAHDFNNLLTVITGYSEILLDEIPEDNPGRRHAREIRGAADRATELTRQLLAFSRKQVLQTKVLDLNTVVGSMQGMLRRLIGEDIMLVTRPGANLGRVKADPMQIEQIILNLAVNARDAMPKGGTLMIETENVHLDASYARQHAGAAEGDYVMLAVSDTGCGMDAETRSHIFEPFFTTKEKGKGTGLGLAMVYGTIKQSGGYIWVYSEPGQGSSFKIYLPLVKAEAESAPAEPARIDENCGKETILLVEDEFSLRELVRTTLHSKGYVVLEASDGKDALNLCERYHGSIDLMLTDVVMPGMSGRELADRLKQLRPGLRVLYMSGYTDSVAVHRGVLDPKMSFIQKPFTLDALARQVRKTLDQGVVKAI